jgi:hypothetical protein
MIPILEVEQRRRKRSYNLPKVTEKAYLFISVSTVPGNAGTMTCSHSIIKQKQETEKTSLSCLIPDEREPRRACL